MRRSKKQEANTKIWEVNEDMEKAWSRVQEALKHHAARDREVVEADEKVDMALELNALAAERMPWKAPTDGARCVLPSSSSTSGVDGQKRRGSCQQYWARVGDITITAGSDCRGNLQRDVGNAWPPLATRQQVHGIWSGAQRSTRN